MELVRISGPIRLVRLQKDVPGMHRILPDYEWSQHGDNEYLYQAQHYDECWMDDRYTGDVFMRTLRELAVQEQAGQTGRKMRGYAS